jgi:hypothetical protein
MLRLKHGMVIGGRRKCREHEVVMHVNDFEQRWPVPDGISANSREVRTVTQPAAPAERSATVG